jgi:hypothetical protein
MLSEDPSPVLQTRAFLAVLGLCLMAGSPSQAQAPGGPQSSATAAPASTGDGDCDAAAAAWRTCIAASPRTAPDKLQANTEVDKFIRDVVDAGPKHKPSLTSACPRMAEGYRLMAQNGTCAANYTGARDDQVSRDQGGRQPTLVR